MRAHAPIAPTPADVSHRLEFEHFVLEHAETWHREHLGRMYQLWTEWNPGFFGGSMTVPYIILATPGSPRSLGDCGTVSGFGGRSQIRVRPTLLTGTHPRIVRGAPKEGRARFCHDVLLHEMIHQWQQEITGAHENGYHGHGRTFRDKCNEIGGRLGLPPVGLKPRGGFCPLPACNHWPHNVRGADYYLGAVDCAWLAPAKIAADSMVTVPASETKRSPTISEVRAIALLALSTLSPAQVEELIRMLEAGVARVAES